jgi:hypothetical protein
MEQRTPARGEPHNPNGAKQGPMQGPPAWTLTKTPLSREPLRAHPFTKASRPQRPEAKPQRTPPGASTQRTNSPPFTRSLKQQITPTSAPSGSPQHRYAPASRPSETHN